jgi:hypothetical protein
VPRNSSKAHFFCTDNELVYWNFFLDFGPLNLGQLYRFCQRLNALLSDKRMAHKRVYYYCSTHSHKRTNACFLISAWQMLYLGRSAEEAYVVVVVCRCSSSSSSFSPHHTMLLQLRCCCSLCPSGCSCAACSSTSLST